MVYVNESTKLKDTISERYIVKLRETNTSHSSVTESNEEKPVRFLSCVVQHATGCGHPMIKLMASVEFISDQSRDPDLHSFSRSRKRICFDGIFIAFSPGGIIEE